MSYILVTGSNGFIAGFLIERLLEMNYKVLGVSTKENKKFVNKNYKHIRVDITQCLQMERIFERYDISAIIHLAAIAHLKDRKKLDWNEFYRVNTLASKTLFTIAAKSNIDVFYASTVDVYGKIEGSIITEDCIPKPNTSYAKSKFLAERILIEKFKNSTSKYLIARFAPVYGMDNMKDIYKRAFIKYPKIAYLIGEGYNYHFVSVHNVVDFILKWIISNEKQSGIYNVCDSELVNSKDLLLYEKKNGIKPKVICIPAKILPLINLFLKIINKIVDNSNLKKIELNLYKIVNPPKYSIEKMKSIYSPEWNLENTVYKKVENQKVHFNGKSISNRQ